MRIASGSLGLGVPELLADGIERSPGRDRRRCEAVPEIVHAPPADAGACQDHSPLHAEVHERAVGLDAGEDPPQSASLGSRRISSSAASGRAMVLAPVLLSGTSGSAAHLQPFPLASKISERRAPVIISTLVPAPKKGFNCPPSTSSSMASVMRASWPDVGYD